MHRRTSGRRSFRARFAGTSAAAALAVLLLSAPALTADADAADAEASTIPAPAPGNYASERSGYTYLRVVTGDATVNSRWNGLVDAKRNMPISAGDEIRVSDSARVEVGLADGNILEVGGGTRVQLESLSAQQGEDEDVSAISLLEGSVMISALGRDENRLPRIDTDDATVYVSAGGRVRVNFDPRRGTSVVGRSGVAEVRARAGSYKVRGGEYLMVHGDEEPEIARGSFSRDRFDLWSAERMDAAADSGRTVSAQYVDEAYASDVEALDGYGDWNYSPTYSSYVWTPHVDINWIPFMNGSWYYTPAGLTWWSSDPWGWFPHHYGNWYFEASWNRWCWSPAAVYSPAWVYWAYTPTHVGWCPIGWYSGWSPWWNQSHPSHGGWNRGGPGGPHDRYRGGSYLAINGTFRPREVDFRGWSFTGANRFGSGRAEIVRGDRIAGQLGPSVAISSRPIVVSARPGDAKEAIRAYVREAPRVIERASTADSSRLAPILSRERALPAETVAAARERTVVAERGRLTGAAAAELAPRGARVERVERGRAIEAVTGPSSAAPGARVVERARPDAAPPARVEAPMTGSDWRARGRAVEAPQPPASSAPAASAGRTIERARPENAQSVDWRTRRISPERSAETRPAEPEAAEPRGRQQDWRTRELPPARRVIDGAVPGRRAERPPDARLERSEAPPRRDLARPDSPAPRPESAPRRPEVGRAETAPAPAPRAESAPPAHRENAPAPRAESHNAPAPAPRAESHPAPPPPQSDRGRKD